MQSNYHCAFFCNIQFRIQFLTSFIISAIILGVPFDYLQCTNCNGTNFLNLVFFTLSKKKSSKISSN